MANLAFKSLTRVVLVAAEAETRTEARAARAGRGRAALARTALAAGAGLQKNSITAAGGISNDNALVYPLL